MELHEINRDYAAAAEVRDFRAGIELNDQFHHTLSRRSLNTHLESMLDDIRGTVRRLETWTFTTDQEDWTHSIAHHTEILTAIEAGDFEAAAETLQRNRLMTYRRFRQSMPGGPERDA